MSEKAKEPKEEKKEEAKKPAETPTVLEEDDEFEEFEQEGVSASIRQWQR
jgi:uncharacterized protein YpmB